MCGDFLKKRRAQRLGVYGCFLKKKMMKMLYKTEHNETQQKQKTSQSPSKNDLLKATMCQRHEDYYGFVKTGFEKRQFYYPRKNMIYIGKNGNVGAILAPIGF